MSLDRKKQLGTKRITVVGLKSDLVAFADVIEQAKSMFNLDLDRKNKDLPIRISISPDVEPEAINYPRTAKILTALSTELKDELHPSDKGTKTYDIKFGKLDWIFNDPSEVTDSNLASRVLQSISEGVSRPGLKAIVSTKHYSPANIGDVKDRLDDTIENRGLIENMSVKNGLLRTIDPKWVYIQTANVSPVTNDKVIKSRKELSSMKQIRDLERRRLKGDAAYPPDLGTIKSSGGRNVEPTQATVAVFRGDMEFDMNQKIKVSAAQWSSFVKKLPEGLLSKELTGSAPKNVGEMLSVYFAYNVATYMKMKDATVRPLSSDKSAIMTEHILDEREQVNRLPKRIGDKILYSALVVGTGDYKPKDYDALHLKEDTIPGWS